MNFPLSFSSLPPILGASSLTEKAQKSTEETIKPKEIMAAIKTKVTKVTEKDKELLKIMVDSSNTPGEAFHNNPEFKERLSHLPYHTISYFFNKFKKKNKNKEENNNSNKNNNKLIKIENIIEPLENPDNLNFCPNCGCGLQNIKNVMKLEQAGKI